MLFSGLIEDPGRVYGFLNSFLTHKGRSAALDVRLDRSVFVVGREAFVPLIVAQFTTERRGMVERGGKITNGTVLCGPLQNSPVVVVTVGVSDPGVDKQKSEKRFRHCRDIGRKRPIGIELNVQFAVSEYVQR